MKKLQVKCLQIYIFLFSVVRMTSSQIVDSMCLVEGVFLDWEPYLQERRYLRCISQGTFFRELTLVEV